MLGVGILVGALALTDESPSAAPRSFFGVVSESPLSTGDLDRMGEGRVGALRMLFDWATIEPTPAGDDRDWSAIDPVVADAIRNGIEPVPFFFGTPAWVARGLDESECARETCGLYAPRTAAALEAWRRFVASAVARYGPGGEFFTEHPALPEAPIRTWQVWNEQNSESFYLPRPDVSGYAALVASAARAIRAADPEAKIILGGMFGTPFGGRPPSLTAWDYLDRLYDSPGIADDFDAVGAHPYAAQMPSLVEQIERIHAEMVAAGDAESELWVTEIGWSSGRGDNPFERGPRGQAERLREAFDYLLSVRDAYRIGNVTWFAWRDLGGPPICEWCSKAGLFEADELKAKPAWDAYATYTGGE